MVTPKRLIKTRKVVRHTPRVSKPAGLPASGSSGASAASLCEHTNCTLTNDVIQKQGKLIAMTYRVCTACNHLFQTIASEVAPSQDNQTNTQQAEALSNASVSVSQESLSETAPMPQQNARAPHVAREDTSSALIPIDPNAQAVKEWASMSHPFHSLLDAHAEWEFSNSPN